MTYDEAMRILRSTRFEWSPREIAHACETLLCAHGTAPVEAARYVGAWYGNLFAVRERLLDYLLTEAR